MTTLRVLETVSEDPFIVSGSEQAVTFGALLEPSLRQLASAVDASLNLVANAKSRKEFIVDNTDEVDEEGNIIIEVQDRREVLKCHPLRRVQLAVLRFEAAFTHARRDIYYTVKKHDGLTSVNSTHKHSYNELPDPHNASAAYSPTSPQIVNTAFFSRTGYDMAPAAQEFAALMAFYIFTLTQFAKRTLSFPDIIEDKRKGKTLIRCVWEELWEPFKSSFVICWELIAFVVPIPSIDDAKALKAAIKLRESAKVSIAMGLSMLFFYYTNRKYAFYGGPAILTFVASNTSSEALYGSMVRMFGTLFGGVIGFFAAEMTNTPTEKVAALSVIMFFFAFFRTGKQYGVAALYACFVVVPLMSPSVKSDEAIARMTQITFAAMIYTIITITVFPTRPMLELANARILAMSNMAATVNDIMDAFCAAFVTSSAEASRSTSYIVRTERSATKDGSSASEDNDPWEVERTGDPLAHQAKDADERKSYPALNLGDIDANFDDGEADHAMGQSMHPFGVERPSRASLARNEPVAKGSRKASRQNSRAKSTDALNAALAPLTALAPVQPEDKLLLTAAAAVKSLEKLVSLAAVWMPLAETEPTLTRVAFPVTANKDFHLTMVKMRSLLDLMVEALKVLRTQRSESPSLYFLAVVDDLHPHALRCAERFGQVVDMIVMTLSRRHAGLASEMVSASLKFEEECLGLHYQKSLSFQILVKLGRIIYDKQLKLRSRRLHPVPPSAALHEVSEDDRRPLSLELLPPSGDDHQKNKTGESQLPKMATTIPYGSDAIHFPPSPPDRGLAASASAVSRTIARTIGSDNDLDCMTRTDLLEGHTPIAVERPSKGIPRDDGKLQQVGVISRASSMPRPVSPRPMGKLVNGRYPTPVSDWTEPELDQLANFIINDSMGLRSILSPHQSTPSSRLATVGDMTSMGTNTVPKLVDPGPHSIRYKKLKMLMTNADSEGMHTFTFSLVIFSKEIKRLVMSVETLQQHMIASE